ncbi:MAG: hypothetical protein K0Q79_3412 [Flavipsychrobacter sp.]|jgi:hypothetical protein|nr:hypothetical protein [Flavipsychrobacter sp.]
MKKLVLLFVCFYLVALKVGAQSMVKVRVADNRQINVWIDGRYFNKRGTSVTVGDIPQGEHKIKIYSMAGTRRGRPYQEVIYYGKVYTYPEKITLLFYDPYTGEVDTRNEYIDEYRKDYPDMKTGDWRLEAPQSSGQPYNDESNNAPSVSPVTSGEPGTLTDGKIDKLKTKADTKKNDTEKMNLLKDALKNETMTTGQVGTLAGWFGFESSKLDFAQWAYTQTVDKELYSDLSAMFTFEQYRQEFEEFLKSR